MRKMWRKTFNPLVIGGEPIQLAINAPASVDCVGIDSEKAHAQV
jgi:hypothetical protein